MKLLSSLDRGFAFVFSLFRPRSKPAKPARAYSIKGWVRDGRGIFKKSDSEIWKVPGGWMRQDPGESPTEHSTLHKAIDYVNLQPKLYAWTTGKDCGANPVDVLRDMVEQAGCIPIEPEFAQARAICNESVRFYAPQPQPLPLIEQFPDL